MPPKPNGFMNFATEWRKKHGASMPEAVERAGKIWSNMSAQERGPYIEKAKKQKIQGKKEKMTCNGIPLSTVDKEKREIEEKERDMKRYIENTVKRSIKNKDLAKQKFYFIMVNYFSKSIDNRIYVPAEISVCEFSLARGVNNKYHSFINPGVVIYGHTFEAKQHSESTHNLPLPPKAFGDKNLGTIYNNILHFIRPDDDSEYPPVYTQKEHIPIVKSVLQFLFSDEGANNVKLNVYSIQHLFYILKTGTCEVGELPKPESVYITDAYFDRDFFEFQTGIACDFHEKEDKSKYCTLSCVTRWGYIFSEYMCNDIAIELIPGRHIPVTTNFATSKSSTLDDTQSFISMGTTASFTSKALPGRGGYYDDQKSYVSDETIISTKDFPKLSSVGKKSKKNTENIRKINEDIDEDEIEENLWTTRSQKIPKQPDSSYFQIDCSKSYLDDSVTDDLQSVNSFGRGRGFLRSQTHQSSYGRGKKFDNRD